MLKRDKLGRVAVKSVGQWAVRAGSWVGGAEPGRSPVDEPHPIHIPLCHSLIVTRRFLEARMAEAIAATWVKIELMQSSDEAT